MDQEKTKLDMKLSEDRQVTDTQLRIAFIKKGESAAVKHQQEETVMSVPSLIVRGVIALEVIMIVIGLLSYAFDAPLEEIANPEHTPNPAKAPWYFLGLQELLHYFHPVVAGILIPLLLVIALVVIPYFDINIKREGLWLKNPKQTFIWLTGSVLGISFLTGWFDAWSIVIPTLIIYILAVMPYFIKHWKGWIAWVARRSLPEWIMIWFVAVVTILTVIGTFFRGPGWSWVWPW
ncbi:MAG: hypothetical protein GWN62_26360 [Aliifodinibius sp.]|nr:hypothetical protein [Fodinibius sp.]